MAFFQSFLKEILSGNVIRNTPAGGQAMPVVIEGYPTAIRPSASLYPEGAGVWDTTLKGFVYSDGAGNWVTGTPGDVSSVTATAGGGIAIGGTASAPTVGLASNVPLTVTFTNGLGVSGNTLALGAGSGLSTGSNPVNLGTGTLTKTSGNITLYGATGSGQFGAIANATGGTTVDTECRAALNALLADLRTRGDLAP